MTFLGFVIHRTQQSKEIIKVYKVPKRVQNVKSYAPESTPPLHKIGETEVVVEPDSEDILAATLDPTNYLTDIPENITKGEPSQIDVSEQLSPGIGGDANVADKIRLEELYIEIPQVLTERLELMNFIKLLDPYYGTDPELNSIIEGFDEDARNLRQSIKSSILEYISLSRDDSPLRPGGDFYELMHSNGIFIEVKFY